MQPSQSCRHVPHEEPPKPVQVDPSTGVQGLLQECPPPLKASGRWEAMSLPLSPLPSLLQAMVQPGTQTAACGAEGHREYGFKAFSTRTFTCQPRRNSF